MYDVAFYYALSKKNAFAYSFNLFSQGDVLITDNNGNTVGMFRPVEFYHSLKYAQTLNPNLSFGLGLKYIESDLLGGIFIMGKETHKGRAIVVISVSIIEKKLQKKKLHFGDMMWALPF